MNKEIYCQENLLYFFSENLSDLRQSCSRNNHDKNDDGENFENERFRE